MAIIARIAAIFGVSALQFILIFVGVAGVGVWFWNVKRVAYNHGYDAAVIECNKRVQEEATRINKAQQDALTQAMDTITKISKEKDDLNVDLDKLKSEASADPDAAHCGLSVGGVRRTNRVR